MQSRRIKMDQVKLQSLRVSAGWRVDYNQFFEVDFDENLYIEGPNGENLLADCFEEDMLQIYSERLQLLIDLGWSDPMDTSGKFVLTLVKLNKSADGEIDFDWENPLEVFKTSSRHEVVNKIEEIMTDATKGYFS